jgi:hypothetical protein
MNKFWEWMEEKDYGFATYGTSNYSLINSPYSDIIYTDSIKQMLIGYMIEYLIDCEETLHFDIRYDNTKMHDDMFDSIFNYLVDKIEELNK